jgi:hypothetical protein
MYLRAKASRLAMLAFALPLYDPLFFGAKIHRAKKQGMHLRAKPATLPSMAPAN